MNTKERLLIIHIRNKLAVHPDYANTFGIEVLPPLHRFGCTVENSGNAPSPESACI